MIIELFTAYSMHTGYTVHSMHIAYTAHRAHTAYRLTTDEAHLVQM